MKYLLAILLFIFFNSSCFSQDQTQAIDISISINADSIFKNRLKSLINRELKKFEDIRVVNQNNAYHTITISVLEARDANHIRGYYSSILVTRVINLKPLIRSLASLEAIGVTESKEREIIQNDYSNSQGEMIRTYLNGSVNNIFNILIADPDLETLAKRIIADINIEVFEITRKSYLPSLY